MSSLASIHAVYIARKKTMIKNFAFSRHQIFECHIKFLNVMQKLTSANISEFTVYNVYLSGL